MSSLNQPCGSTSDWRQTEEAAETLRPPPQCGTGTRQRADSSRVFLWISVMNPGHTECPDIMSSHNNKSALFFRAKPKTCCFMFFFFLIYTGLFIGFSRSNQLRVYDYTQSGGGLIIAWTEPCYLFIPFAGSSYNSPQESQQTYFPLVDPLH